MSRRSAADEEVHYCDGEPVIEYRADHMVHITYQVGARSHRYVMPPVVYRRALRCGNLVSDEIGEHRVVSLRIQR